ncbi:MAG: Bax inhibitor-1/YccA family protein, partial [Candidatus Poseidonia sp.]|nr:Bax inhibitor-1/YccA family protein [Poseidonia sp.]
MEIRSSNPVLSQKFWSNLTGTDRMTVDGSLRKIGFLLSLTVLSAFVSAVLALSTGDPMVITAMMGIGFMGGLVIALIVMF